MSFVLRRTLDFFAFCGQRWYTTFALGVVAGVGFELTKVHWTVNGVNFYSVLRRKQIKYRLDEFEMQLKMADYALAHKPVDEGKL